MLDSQTLFRRRNLAAGIAGWLVVLVWLAPPAAASVCSQTVQPGDPEYAIVLMEVTPSQGQAGDPLYVKVEAHGEFYAAVYFGDIWLRDMAVAGNDQFFYMTLQVPNVPPDSYIVTAGGVWGQWSSASCTSLFTVHAETTVVTEDTLDLTTVTTATTEPPTTATTEPPTTATTEPATTTTGGGGGQPGTSAPTTTSGGSDQPGTTAPGSGGAVASTTAPGTTVSSETTTTPPDASTSAPQTTLVAAASSDGGSSSGGLLLGLLLGLGISAVAAFSWALGRRGRTGPGNYPAPPPPTPPPTA
jgi:hypothetical protein